MAFSSQHTSDFAVADAIPGRNYLAVLLPPNVQRAWCCSSHVTFTAVCQLLHQHCGIPWLDPLVVVLGNLLHLRSSDQPDTGIRGDTVQTSGQTPGPATGGHGLVPVSQGVRRQCASRRHAVDVLHCALCQSCSGQCMVQHHSAAVRAGAHSRGMHLEAPVLVPVQCFLVCCVHMQQRLPYVVVILALGEALGEQLGACST